MCCSDDDGRDVAKKRPFVPVWNLLDALPLPLASNSSLYSLLHQNIQINIKSFNWNDVVQRRVKLFIELTQSSKMRTSFCSNSEKVMGGVSLFKHLGADLYDAQTD